MSSAKELSTWVLENYPYNDPITHLKLQKLLFYCYGLVLASGCERALGDAIDFQPWEHGPVNREIWSQYKSYQSAEIPVLNSRTVNYAPLADSTLRDALAVYGLLDAWRLRQQSHLEKPWNVAYQQRAHVIDHELIRRHFAHKFFSGSVNAPEYLLDTGTLRLDNIPVQGYPSFAELARVLKNEFKDKVRILQP
jgi:uncharacterized phage-associated protein